MVTNEPDPSYRRLRAATVVTIVLAPVALVSILLARFYVPIPYKDDWSIASLVSANSVSIQALFHQHNEHICFIPKLILTALARSTGWSLHFEPALNILFVLTSVIALVGLARSEGYRSPIALLIAGFGSSVFLFSPAQYDVFLWPWMITATITTCLLCLGALALGTGKKHGFNVAIVCCVLAAVSSAQGLFTWLTLLPVAAWNQDHKRIDRKRLTLWCIATAASWAFYFLIFKSQDTPSTIRTNLAHPVGMMEFVAAVVGGPWVRNPQLAVLVGSTQIFLFGWFVVLALRTRFASRALALAGIATWVVIFGAASGAGRLQYGIETAVTSRYLASSAVLPAAFFVLVALLARHRPRASLRIGLASVLVISAAWVYSTSSSLPGWELASLDRVRGALCLGMLEQTGGDTNACIEIIAPLAEPIARIDAVEESGIRTFRRTTPVPIERSTDWAGRISPRIRKERDERLEVGGTMIKTESLRSPGLVFLDAGDGRLWCCGFSEPFSTVPASPGTKQNQAVTWRADIPRKLIEGSPGIVGFALFLDPDRLVPLEGIIEPDPWTPTTVYSPTQTEGP